MNSHAIIDGLLGYVCLVILLTFHEFAHAWTAWKCGDDTAHSQGRVSLNPLVHMDLMGTVILPLLVVFLSAANSGLARFIIGWGKPVPVDISQLRHRRRDDTLVALAGPAMNLALAVVLMAVAKGFDLLHLVSMAEVAIQMTLISLLLCFFNLLPIPPLDGSHVLKNLIGMSDEVYWNLCRFGFVAVLIAIQVPYVRMVLNVATITTFSAMAKLVGLG